jgi:gluconate 2-dehydrogenase gamma chain
MQRRDAVELMLLAPLSAAFDWTPADVAQAALRVRRAAATGTPIAPKFFTPHEWETVRVLADLVIPRDERSGSATDAQVPEFIDFVMTDRPEGQNAMRGGLAWLDTECRRRFGKTFVACAEAERAAVLDDIAWPDRAKAEVSHGVAFFNRFRDLTASGFWSSKMGVEDLRYMGNTAIAQWQGCPPAALQKLGVRYDEWTRRYGRSE